ncbi:unnamed protein product [Effrenium voratum]|nr:unnamed protein product [Effrenium voratum]
MLLFQGDVMLEGSLVSWKRQSIKGLPPAKGMRSSASLQASASSLFKSTGRGNKNPRRTQSIAMARSRSVASVDGARARSKDEMPSWYASMPQEETKPEEKRVEAEEEPREASKKAPEAVEIPEAPEPEITEREAVQLSGFSGQSSSLNGIFAADGDNTLNGKQVYSQGDGLECMWYHNGAWRIGSYSWFTSRELGRCHAFVKTEASDVGEIKSSEIWMSSVGGGDPDQGSVFQPQLSAKALKTALDGAFKRSNSKKATPLASSSNRLTNILTDQFIRHDIELPPELPVRHRGGSKEEASLPSKEEAVTP